MFYSIINRFLSVTGLIVSDTKNLRLLHNSFSNKNICEILDSYLRFYLFVQSHFSRERVRRDLRADKVNGSREARTHA